MKVLVVYYSMYGHIHQMAEAIADGAREIAGADVQMRRVPETLPRNGIGKDGGGRTTESVFPCSGLHGGRTSGR